MSNQGFNRPKDHWGKHLWAFLHTMSICDFNIPEVNLRTQKPITNNIKMLIHSIPCQTCKDHFTKNIKSIDSLDLNKPNVLFYWTVDFHNKVNEKLGKLTLSYTEAEEIWCNKIDG